MAKRFLYIFLLFLTGCQPKFDVYAPEKEIFVVYGILDPDKREQYIKVSRVFQFEGDAYYYAAQNDLSVRGLWVTVKGGGKTYEAAPVDQIPRDSGVFLPSGAAYMFETRGGDSLVPGERYELEILRPDDPEFRITAWTDIPTEPRLKSPGKTIVIRGYLYAYPSVSLDDEYDVRFERGSGKGFEVRVWAEYESGADVHRIQWGPSPVFFDSYRCPGSAVDDVLCYRIYDGSVARAFQTALSEETGPIYFQDEPTISHDIHKLPNNAMIEVTAIDSFLALYLYQGDPGAYGVDLLMDRKEYSNISGDHVGIFGSIHRRGQYVFLDECTRYLSGLSYRPYPPPGCE